jgi:ADP-heptose:LPS heptosyltransferase
MEILVINLMRLGDLIQASPVLRGLQCAYLGARITLLAMDAFAEPARLVPGVDRLLLFPSLTLAAALDQNKWPEAFHYLHRWFDENLPPRPDVVINLTPNLMGGILALAARGRERRGFAVDNVRGGFTSSAWASYGLVVSKARQANPFNLADMFVRGAGLQPDGSGLVVNIPQAAQAEADAAIQALKLRPETARVGLLPGASQAERRWPPENFAQAANILRKTRPCHFFIFGSSGEAPLGEAIRSLLPPGEVTQCQGRTSPALLGAYLKRLELLLTNDTGPMHLAAALGTPVLALFLASARAQDTGPAGKGHIVIEPEINCHPCLSPCSQPRCQNVINPEAVGACGLHLLENGPADGLAGMFYGDHLKVYYSDIDPAGYQVYLPLVRRPLRRRDFWLWVHRLAWTRLLDRQTGDSEVLRDRVRKILGGCYLPPSGGLGSRSGQQALAEIMRLAAQGGAVASEISRRVEDRPAALLALQPQMENFGAIDLNLRRLAVDVPELASLIEFYFQDQRRHAETQIVPLAQSLARAYGGLRRMAAVFRQAVQELAWGETSSGVAQDMQTDMKIPRTYHEDSGWPHAGDYQ